MIRRCATGTGERPGRIQRGTLAIAEHRHGPDGIVGAAAELRPCRTVPSGDIVCTLAVRNREKSSCVENRSAAIVEAGDGNDSTVHSAAQTGPTRSVPGCDVAKRNTA